MLGDGVLTEEGRGANMGSHRRRNGRVAVFFLYALGKERKEALARKRSPNQVRRDG